MSIKSRLLKLEQKIINSRYSLSDLKKRHTELAECADFDKPDSPECQELISISDYLMIQDRSFRDGMMAISESLDNIALNDPECLQNDFGIDPDKWLSISETYKSSKKRSLRFLPFS